MPVPPRPIRGWTRKRQTGRGPRSDRANGVESRHKEGMVSNGGGHIEELGQFEGWQSRDDGPAEDGPGHCAILAGDKLDFVGVEASQGLPT